MASNKTKADEAAKAAARARAADKQKERDAELNKPATPEVGNETDAASTSEASSESTESTDVNTLSVDEGDGTDEIPFNENLYDQVAALVQMVSLVAKDVQELKARLAVASGGIREGTHAGAIDDLGKIDDLKA